MPKKTNTASGRLNFRLSEKLHQRLLRYTAEEGHNDISDACRYLLNLAMIERYGRPTLVYSRANTPSLKVADAPTDNAP
jgi:hypothetical protein